MQDRLVWLLNCFELRAGVFQAGPLCRTVQFDADDGLGYIHVLKQGRLRVETVGQPPLLLQQPSLLFYMNPTGHRLLPQDEQVDLVCASFDFGSGMRNPLAQALPEGVHLALDDSPALQASVDLLFTEASEMHCGRQAALDRLMEVVIIHLLRDLMDANRLDFGLLAGLADARLARAINAMHEQPARAWTLEDLAEVAGMSRARFASRFRDTVGITPGNYLAEWRIGVAQALLRRGKPVQLVADEVGYGSASALSRAFASQLGMSPAAWRKQVLTGA
jgi:AraC-like DNA-binding protein